MLKRYTLFVLFALILGAAPASAAKVNVFKDAAAAIKSRSNLAKNRDALVKFANDSTTTSTDAAKAYSMAAQVCQCINRVENEKAYLKQKYDTVAFFAAIRDMYHYVLLADSVEGTTIAGEKGKYKYRKVGATMLRDNRENLLNGGKWNLVTRKYKEAYELLDLYLSTIDNPVCSFGDEPYSHKIAYWAVQCSNASGNHQGTLHYVDSAMALGQNIDYLYKFKAEAQNAVGDTEGWITTLEKGMREYPNDTYFFVHLVDYMRQAGKHQKALDYAEEMVKAQPDTTLYRYTRSLIYLDTEQWDKCIEAANDVIAHDKGCSDAYYNKGMSYLKRAIIFTPEACLDLDDPKCAEDRRRLRALYTESKEAMEQYRTMRPEDKDRWAPVLYHVYLNLNMGNEFAEMEQLLRK